MAGDGSNRGKPEEAVPPHGGSPAAAVDRRVLDDATSARAARRWWDSDARAYWAEHANFLGSDDFVWCPEGLREAEAGLLGPVAGLDVLEVGCGTAPCSRWLETQGAHVTALDVSGQMLEIAREHGAPARLVQADAGRLPFGPASFDLACSAFGAIPFLGNLPAVFAGIARVLRPGGRWVFATSHPVRWCFPDDGGPAGLTAVNSYWDRRAYVELDASGEVGYAEHHHTLGDLVGALAGAGFRIDSLVEPEWRAGLEEAWGGWSPLRGRILPGTVIFTCTSLQGGAG